MFDENIRSPRPKAFTLIELLIVIAIIAILASIALPNFIEAQTRAKVSRAMADMRSVATALEAYFVDNNSYPRGAPVPEATGVPEPNYTPLSRRLAPITTPIAYMTTLPEDAFPAAAGSNGLAEIDIDTYDYYDAASDKDEDGAGLGDPPQGRNSTRWCVWRLASAGPDLYQSFGMYPDPSATPDPGADRRDWGVDYDPTNGSVSRGDIVRTGAKYR